MLSVSHNSPNILLIVLDSVRAANTSLHNHHNETTPFLDSFRKRASTYWHARAPGTESISSHTSIFTGLSVREHGITNRHNCLDDGYTIWEGLAENGYETAVFSSNPFLTELPVGLRNTFELVVGRNTELPFPEAVNPKNFVIDSPDRGVKKYVDFLRAAVDNGRIFHSLGNGIAFKFGGGQNRLLPDSLQPDPSAERYADRFLQWQASRNSPWAACINFMDAHYPYEPGPNFDQWGGPRIGDIQDSIEDQAWEYVSGRRPWGERRAIESLYDGAIRRMDAAVERIVSNLEASGEFDQTLIAITADHGEGFGEQSRIFPDVRIVGHGNGGLHESVLHIPLVVKYPGQSSPIESEQVTSLDEFPAAVRDAINGSWGINSFASEGPVVCSTAGIDPDTADRAREYCADVKPYDQRADAVYTDEPSVVKKNIRWGEKTSTVTVRNAHTAWTESDSTIDVEAIVSSLSDADVRRSADQDIATDIKNRLEDLGYA